MASNVVSVRYNGGPLPDIILLTHGYCHQGTRLNAMNRFVLAAFATTTVLNTLCSGKCKKHVLKIR